eukprot:m.668254 g.668254  ORF g.668254 m.668254 type:complete len:308 (+) comp58517_c0_seq3:378-1301(+)
MVRELPEDDAPALRKQLAEIPAFASGNDVLVDEDAMAHVEGSGKHTGALGPPLDLVRLGKGVADEDAVGRLRGDDCSWDRIWNNALASDRVEGKDNALVVGGLNAHLNTLALVLHGRVFGVRARDVERHIVLSRNNLDKGVTVVAVLTGESEVVFATDALMPCFRVNAFRSVQRARVRHVAVVLEENIKLGLAWLLPEVANLDAMDDNCVQPQPGHCRLPVGWPQKRKVVQKTKGLLLACEMHEVLVKGSVNNDGGVVEIAVKVVVEQPLQEKNSQNKKQRENQETREKKKERRENTRPTCSTLAPQ